MTRRDILAHQTSAPWPNLLQVEQDLILCRTMAALFNDKFLRSQIAMRGGTLLHKVHLVPPARYSEDIDLVVIGKRPGSHIAKALRRVLHDLLGNPVDQFWGPLKLAIRNIAKPSRILRQTYAVPSIAVSGQKIQIVIEANVTERNPHRSVLPLPFGFKYEGSTVQTTVNSYDLHEMLGTKLRALFQRRRGRDLFDLYRALTAANPPVDPAVVIDSFLYYLNQEGGHAKRSEFIALLDGHLADRGFCSDMNQLLRTGETYDPHEAGTLVKSRLLSLLPA